MVLRFQIPEKTQRLQSSIREFLKEREGAFPAHNQLKRLANLILPDPHNPASYLFPLGITKIGKENIWREVGKAISEGKNVYHAYHATYRPRSLVTEGLHLPMSTREPSKGPGFFAATDPWLGVAQRGSSPYTNPKEFYKTGGGVVRMLLAPEETFTIPEESLSQVGRAFGRHITGDVLANLAPMTKLTKADLSLGFPHSGVTEYIIRDPNIVKVANWRGVSRTLNDWSKTEYLPTPIEKIRREGGREFTMLKELQKELMELGKIERRVVEKDLSIPQEWVTGEVQERLWKRGRKESLADRVRKLMVEGVSEGGYQPFVPINLPNFESFPSPPSWNTTPIPLTQDQHQYLKAVFGADLEQVKTPVLQQALKIIEASPFKFSSIQPETVKTVQMALGMKLKNLPGGK